MKSESQKSEKKAKKKVPVNELDLNMYVLTNGGLQADLYQSIWYFVNGIGETWLHPKLFERMMLEDPDLTELAKKADTDEAKKEVEAKILDIFKKKYLLLLWRKFNSIKGLVTDYAIEKSRTKEWNDDLESYAEVPEEPSEIKFVKYN